MPACYRQVWKATVISDKRSILALASGEIFLGRGFGHPGPASGEVVFNTSLSGYQEIITDPSYQGQLICMTMPHIGIVGINSRDEEASTTQASALIVRALSRSVSNWRANGSLAAYCARHKLAGITEVDTRTLTQLLRDRGSVNACLLAGDDTKEALQLARACGDMAGKALGASAGCSEKLEWDSGNWDAVSDTHAPALATAPSVAVFDCGAKRAIMRELATRDLQVTIVPYTIDAAILADSYAGVVLSNGPGDPVPLAKAIELARTLLARKVPTLGICLGHQILAQAAGAVNKKMKFGHHGANHPVLDHATKQVFISSQNHNFAVDMDSLPAHLDVTHTSLFDGTIQGLRHRDKPAISFQGHPEASPGPHELTVIFDRFAVLVRTHATHC